MVDTNFYGPETFWEAGVYQLMPFRFGRLTGGRILLTNPGGEFSVIPQTVFDAMLAGRLSHESPDYLDLKAKSFITHNDGTTTIRLAASQWRTKKAFLEGGPKLHIFVPTLRCNQSCGYCQVSRANATADGVDMTQQNASRAIDLMLSVPARAITMEFQGGEPLLAFDLVRWMVETTTERAFRSGKKVNYVICTNLTILNDEHLEFFKEYAVAISTSLDGPIEIHDRNRPTVGISAHTIVTANIRRCHEELGPGSVSALMTTTSHSLKRAQDIIDEYIVYDLGVIFLREINPYGFAAKYAKSAGYGTGDFVAFYHEALERIISLNRQGIPIAEGYASILLRKILTPFGVGFVDLQSPTGEGFGTVLYNYDGAVYASDEARMLAQMGDESFRLGSVTDTYAELMFGETMQVLAAAGVAEALPGCSDCVYVPYCGAAPIRHYRTQGDIIGHRSTSEFCRKQKAIFNIIFELLSRADHQTMDILLGWLNPHRSCLPKPTWQS